MKLKWLVLLAVVAIAVAPSVSYACACCGCRGGSKHSHDKEQQVAPEKKACPADCSKACCAAKQEKEAESEAPKLCGCGEVKGSENCCNPDAAKCGSCGKIKGSPGCCK